MYWTALSKDERILKKFVSYQIKNKNESIDKNFLLVQKNFSRKCVVDIKITQPIDNKIPQLECTTNEYLLLKILISE